MSCKTHLQNFRFVCETDLELLCPDCILTHSKLHSSSNSQMDLKSLQQFQQQISNQLSKTKEKLVTLQKRSEILSNPSSLYQQLGFQNLKQTVIKHIQKIFQQIQQQITRIVGLEIEDSEENIKDIKNLIAQVKGHSDFSEIQSQVLKMIEYKKKIPQQQKFLERCQAKIDELSIDKLLCPFKIPSIEFLKKQLTSVIFSLIQKEKTTQISQKQIKNETTYLQKQHSQKQQNKQNNEVSKKSGIATFKKKQVKKKKCEDCGQELQYLTDLKKHLVCRSCGNKKRNYIKKL